MCPENRAAEQSRSPMLKTECAPQGLRPKHEEMLLDDVRTVRLKVEGEILILLIVAIIIAVYMGEHEEDHIQHTGHSRHSFIN